VHLRIPDLATPEVRAALAVEDSLIKSACDKADGATNWNPALHPRAGTAPNPGWFAPTDEESNRVTPIQAAQNSVAGQASAASATNSKAGDPFPTPQAAAVAALLEAHSRTRSTGLEYAGRIYQNPDGSYSYTLGRTFSQVDPTIPNRNCCPGFSTPGDVPAGTRDVGSFHTHPDEPARGASSADFSPADVMFYTYTDKRVGYVAGTNEQGIGVILQFTPGETPSQGITQIVGTVVNGSFVPNPAFDPNKKPYTPPPEGDSYDPAKDDPPGNAIDPSRRAPR
jgi:hypothetical protein